MKQGKIGLIGLAVMGRNLALNIAENGFPIVVHNRTQQKVDEFMASAEALEPEIACNLISSQSLEDFVSQLERPKRVLLMVKAGPAVDQYIEKLLPYLEEGDCIIDGGNSLFTDTNRRCRALEAKGLLYVGLGVSGGEEGARRGPSLMPGGSREAWPLLQDIFQAIAARTKEAEICCDWVGPEGSGHFVKMVHNGIEYGDMQLICEAYQVLKDGLGYDYPQMQKVFTSWQRSELDSYLIDITSDILGRYSPVSGKMLPVVEQILDTAGQKGTGRWTGINALELGIPLSLIAEAVFARNISAMKEQRLEAAKQFPKTAKSPFVRSGDSKEALVEDLRLGLLAAKIISYTQGYMLIQQAAEEYQWPLNYGGIALMCRGGCIIRSVFLGKIKEAFDEQPALSNLLFAPYFQQKVKEALPSWRRILGRSIEAGLPMPAFSAALSFFDSYSSAQLPANLLQAQRDYFGSHSYERTNQPRGVFFHTDWIGSGKEEML